MLSHQNPRRRRQPDSPRDELSVQLASWLMTRLDVTQRCQPNWSFKKNEADHLNKKKRCSRKYAKYYFFSAKDVMEKNTNFLFQFSYLY